MRNLTRRIKEKKTYLGLIGLFLLLSYILTRPEESIVQVKIKLYLHNENRIVELDLEDYITGTLAAEMPAYFELEALKAQAVAIRTYTVRKLLSETKYPLNADMSDDINSCQAFISRENFKQRNPKQGEELWSKLSQAVGDTRGELLVYEEEPIDALYFSTCGGRTASASESLGRDIPYLRSVNCEYCKESKHFEEVLVFSHKDLSQALGLNLKKNQVQITATNPSGRVKEIKVNQQVMSGECFRKALNLPSSWIKVKNNANEIIINSRGYGHGIGLCQYGANGMAQEGKSYRQILHKYYQGVDFIKLDY